MRESLMGMSHDIAPPHNSILCGDGHVVKARTGSQPLHELRRLIEWRRLQKREIATFPCYRIERCVVSRNVRRSRHLNPNLVHS